MYKTVCIGSIDNSFYAVIRNDEEIPELWKEIHDVHILRAGTMGTRGT